MIIDPNPSANWPVFVVAEVPLALVSTLAGCVLGAMYAGIADPVPPIPHTPAHAMRDNPYAS